MILLLLLLSSQVPRSHIFVSCLLNVVCNRKIMEFVFDRFWSILVDFDRITTNGDNKKCWTIIVCELNKLSTDCHDNNV